MAAPLQIQDCWKIMLRGSEMLKVSGGKMAKKKILKKTVCLEHDLSAINYRPTKKRDARIESSSIVSVTFDESVEKSVRRFGKSFSENCSIGLKLKSGRKFILQAQTPELAEMWRFGLKRLIEIGPKDPRNSETREMWLRKEFNKLANTLGKGEVSFKVINDFLPSLKIGLKSQPDFIKSMKEFGGNDTLNVDQFIVFFNAKCTKKYEVAFLKGLARNGVVLTPEDIQYFLSRVQKQPDVTYDTCVKFIEAYEPSDLGRERKELCLEGLTRYLLSAEGDVFNKEHDAVYHNMTQPLNQYFISSSHNTYLMGDQLRSVSAAQAYVDALRKGYKCVEIDCHDGKGGEPFIFHKHTLTKEVALTDVLKAIRDNAFVVSPYPVIVSVENHCSVETQKKMARYFEEIFGNLLYKEAVLETEHALPSPEDLRNKILVRGKKAKPPSGDGKRNSVLDESDFEENGDSRLADAGLEAKATDNLQPPSGAKRAKIAEEFSRLINHLENKKFVSFEAAASMKFYHTSSFSENRFAELSGADLVHFNKKHTTRIYPGGSRMDSSNYNPQKAWNSGCQIVALNQQTKGMATDLNLGRFRQNGRAGYNLKPKFLRDVECTFDPNNGSVGIQGKVLYIAIISASLLSAGESRMGYRDVPDPYVVVEIHGIDSDTYKDRTKTVWNNPFNPHWGEGFQPTIQNPELAMLRLAVYDEDPGFDDFMGQFSLPLPSLQVGIRRVPLLDKEGRQMSGASLLVYSEFSDLKASQESLKPSKCGIM